MPYIKSDAKSDECVFCEMIAQDSAADAKNYVLHRGKNAFVVLNLYPYNNGHLMVVPYEHVSTLDDLAPVVQSDMMYLVSHSVALLRRVMEPAGFNIGINLGKAAGAGIDAHIHIHVVPRWFGDTNFMPVIAKTRVIPEWLDETYQKLKAEIDADPPPC
jgi:ATP adenylyltransferase